MTHTRTRVSATGIDYSNASRLVAMLTENGGRRGNPEVEDAIRQIQGLGVSFDGRQYSYKGYRYDVLADALNYALLDRSRSGHQGAGGIVAQEWRDSDRPTAADEASMSKLHITFDGHHYHFAGYRYDRLADACRYAELKQKH